MTKRAFEHTRTQTITLHQDIAVRLPTILSRLMTYSTELMNVMSLTNT